MGATYMRAGGLKRNTVGKWADKIFGISYAVRFHNSAPREANFDKPNDETIQMTVATQEQDVLLQFRLTRGDALQIKGYDPNIPANAKVVVDSVYPSVDVVIAEGRTMAERAGAQRLKDILGKTIGGVSVESMSRLANELKRRKGRKLVDYKPWRGGIR